MGKKGCCGGIKSWRESKTFFILHCRKGFNLIRKTIHSLFVTNDSFIKRLCTQIVEIFNDRFLYPLKRSHREDPIKFIGLSLVLIPLFLMVIIFILFGVWVFFFHSIKIPDPITELFFPILGILMISMVFGLFILGPRREKSVLERETQESKLKTIKQQDMKLQEDDKKKKIFVVHGHDSKTKDEVTKYLRNLGLLPIVLQDEPNRGKTIIEKVEYYVKQTAFAIIILSKDDFGVAKKDFDIDKIKQKIDHMVSRGLSSEIRKDIRNLCDDDDYPLIVEITDLSEEMLKHIKTRTRQNVIFELGITFGYLDRHNVRVLYEEGVELPTDVLGLSYTPLDDHWKENILKELKAAGIECKDIK